MLSSIVGDWITTPGQIVVATRWIAITTNIAFEQLFFDWPQIALYVETWFKKVISAERGHSTSFEIRCGNFIQIIIAEARGASTRKS